MKKIFPLALILLLLAACGSGEVGAGGGLLRATAQLGASSYSFNCDPAAQNNEPIYIGNHFAMTCPSSDQKANLTVLIDQSTTPDGKSTTYLAGAVLLVIGPPSTTSTAAGQLGSYSRLGNSSFSAEFNLSGAGGLKVTGDFSLSAK